MTITSVTFSWLAPAGPVAGYTIQVIDGYVPWRDLDTTTATSYHHTGLDPDTVHRYRIIAEPVTGSGYTASEPSGILWATTDPLPEQVPPTAPGTPSALRVSTVGTTIHFAAATNATINRDGELATAVPASWYRLLQPGSGAMFGGGASYPAGSPLPSDFAVHYGSEAVGCT